MKNMTFIIRKNIIFVFQNTARSIVEWIFFVAQAKYLGMMQLEIKPPRMVSFISWILLIEQVCSCFYWREKISKSSIR